MIFSKKIFNFLFNLRRKIYTPIKDHLRSEPIYIFHHIPKCGGTSVRNALNSWFEMKLDYAPPTSSEEFVKYKLNKYNISKFKPYQCLVSHFESSHTIYKRYPQVFKDNRYRVFSFVRDPLQTSISLWTYRKLKYPEKEEFNINLEEHLSKVKNFLAFNLSCNKDNYKEVINQYLFIGIIEEAQMSFDYLAKLIKRPAVKLPHSNKSNRNSVNEELSSEIVESFIERNKLDYSIYQYIKEKFNIDL